MPKPFSADQKETIRAKLMEVGRACFLRYGLKKTTIDDLVKPTGIAKASFYLFFDTKEALYLEIFLQEIPGMMGRLMAGSFDRTDDTREALVLMMKGIAHEMETNELSRVILDDPADIKRFADTLNYEGILQQVAGSYAPIIEAIVAAQERGEIIPGDPFQIAYSLGLVKMLVMQSGRIPPPLYESMMEFAPQVIADGLTCPARTRKGGTK
ncbi:TetR/AcrR family transcriptional regulator [Candidatus Bipolaricaulota bacterium]|nr:TetR/AcrR family transcriptional regulator [Candidatus Bipolaricaulota bacterium]